MKKIALFSYKPFFKDVENGWKQGLTNKVLLIQDPESLGQRTTRGSIEQIAKESDVVVENGWQCLAREINEIDELFIYIGSYGADQAIKLVCNNNIPDSKLTFVMSDRDLVIKMRVIEKCGYENVTVIMCEPGGRKTMTELYNKYIKG